MSNLGSQKRKQRTSERANLPEAEAILDTVLHEDFDLAEHTKSIRSGTHSEFLKRKEALVFEMEKKIILQKPGAAVPPIKVKTVKPSSSKP